ncbi:MAG: FecR family protein [Niastella sp.]|uniref:FecR family protein n=1 Tax=Niastella sp. TaxID=1869183 RepID=UPI00389A7E58
MSVPEEQLLAALAEKFLTGTATAVEQEQLHQLYDQWMDEEETVVSETKQTEELRIEILQAIKDRINGYKKVIPFYRRKLWTFMAAASILIVASLLLYYYSQPASQQNEVASKEAHPGSHPSLVVPGKDRATLTLSNGAVIDLDSSRAGLLAQQGNTSIINKDGKIMYAPGSTGKEETISNTISTPRGGQYQLVLPDGTKVWLNATSALQFPVAFTGSNRTVELTGEAYFEVAKNPARPFIVKVKELEVKVLGTHFNINAYDNEPEMKTTLLEGSVKVEIANEEKAKGKGQKAKGEQSVILKPGEQVSLSQSSQLSQPIPVQTEEVIGWKNGKFYFNNADLKVIMRQIARWYDVEVEYRDISPDTQLGGVVSRKEDLRQLLNYFEIAGKVHFTVEGRKIIVTR